MPTPVKVYTYMSEAAEAALNELEWTMYELPQPGVRYWHGDEGFTVREVDQSPDPPHVHLLYDHEWMNEVRSQLPDGYAIDGGRQSDSGEWHFVAGIPPGELRLGAFVDDLDEALDRVIAAAHEHDGRAQEAQG